MQTKKAVLYLRSSKDQRDVSIQSQRHELAEIAERRGLLIVGEYSDAVESGKEWDRPGFQNLIREIRNPARGWSSVLCKDTSRIARRRNLSLIFEEQECASSGVEVVYANMPESGDPATLMILRTMLQAMDEWHSITSRDKGLAGMAETMRQGYRPAGKAPVGYRLKKMDIGLIREGAPVLKTVLEPDQHAKPVGEYLTLRAAGIARAQAAATAGLDLKPSSLIGIEWNALAYAGCTTFGVYHERTSTGGYKGKRKRRPRAEWMVQADTHPAVIERAQAEALIARLEQSDQATATRRGKAGVSRYLLMSMLVTPSGETWQGSRGVHYFAPRGAGKRNRYLPTATVDKAVIDRLLADLRDSDFAERILTDGKQGDSKAAGEIKKLQKRIAEIAVLIDRAAELALQIEDPAPYNRKIESLERERRDLIRRQAEMKDEEALAEARAKIRPETVKGMMEELADAIAAAPADQLRLALARMVRTITLDPDSLECQIEYALGLPRSEINPDSMALLRERAQIRVFPASDCWSLDYVDGRATRWARRRGV